MKSLPSARLCPLRASPSATQGHRCWDQTDLGCNLRETAQSSRWPCRTVDDQAPYGSTSPSLGSSLAGHLPFWFLGSGVALVTGVCLSSPGGSNVQPGLRSRMSRMKFKAFQYFSDLAWVYPSSPSPPSPCSEVTPPITHAISHLCPLALAIAPAEKNLC